MSLLSIGTLSAVLTAAQEMPADALPQQSLRAYWHVFIAYAIVLVLVLGWVISIARRLGAVERRLGAGRDGGSPPPQGT